MRRSLCRGVLLIAALLVCSAATAQTVRVTKDRATVWSRDPSLVIAVLREGTILETLGKDGKWYIVVILRGEGKERQIGYIFEGNVEVASGEVPDVTRAVPGTQPARRAEPRRARRKTTVGVKGFAEFNYLTFSAQRSFDAILDEHKAPSYGGGVEATLRSGPLKGLLFAVSADRFRKTGQRVFVFDGEVFPLGIEETITITPIVLTVGYAFGPFGPVTPYGGGGVGSYKYEEKSAFADASEEVDERFTGYHLTGGVGVNIWQWLGAGAEFRWATVPDSLGDNGVSKEFGDDDLGGTSVRFKILLGR